MAYQVDRLSSIVSILQSVSVQNDDNDNDTINNNDSTVQVDDRYGYSITTIDGELILLFRSLILLFRLAYRIDRMYQAGKILSSTVLLLGPESVYNDKDYTIAIMQLLVLYGRNNYYYQMKLTSTTEDTSASTRTNEERTACYSASTRTNGERTACYSSQDHFNKDKVKINVTLISTNQNGEYKKIEEKEERSKEPVPSFIQMCLCFCSSIVTLNRGGVHNVLGQSMGSVKIHKDRLNRASQTRTFGSTFGSAFGIQLRTLESCIQSDVFVCSSLLKRMFFPT